MGLEAPLPRCVGLDPKCIAIMVCASLRDCALVPLNTPAAVPLAAQPGGSGEALRDVLGRSAPSLSRRSLRSASEGMAGVTLYSDRDDTASAADALLASRDGCLPLPSFPAGPPG